MAECAEEAEIAQISLKELNSAKTIDDVLELAQEAVQNAAGLSLNKIFYVKIKLNTLILFEN